MYMKKLVFALALMLPMMAQGVSIKTIQAGWKNKVITDVPTGGLGIMLERFDQTWPTSAVGDVCQVICLSALSVPTRNRLNGSIG